MVHCLIYRPQRWKLQIDGRVDTRKLLNTRDGAATLSNWWLENGIQSQFRLARVLDEVGAIG